ncbi:MAG: TerB family tellurite resistance protein [Rhodoblastus sp.]
MLDKIFNLFDKLAGSERKSVFAPDDYRVAAAALLVNMANADGHVAPEEQRRLQKILADRFELTPENARELLQRAEKSEREAVGLYQFTSVLKRALDEPGRLAVVELLWDMAYADNHADEIEENTVWRIAELLGVATRDRILAKRKAEKAGPEALPADPWRQDGSDA